MKNVQRKRTNEPLKKQMAIFAGISEIKKACKDSHFISRHLACFVHIKEASLLTLHTNMCKLLLGVGIWLQI